MSQHFQFYVLVDKDQRPFIAGSNVILTTVANPHHLPLMDHARPDSAPHAWLELVPKPEMTPPEALADRLINVWCDNHGGKIPWDKAIKITAIVCKMPDDERDRLLGLD